MWKEAYTKNYTFYCGLFDKKDFRLGITLGNQRSDIDLGWFTMGFMKR